jgi:hypothetical protein
MDALALWILVFFCAGVGMLAGFVLGREYWHRELIKRGLAHYDAKDGEWKWNVTSTTGE